jgi:hypothetical protein
MSRQATGMQHACSLGAKASMSRAWKGRQLGKGMQAGRQDSKTQSGREAGRQDTKNKSGREAGRLADNKVSRLIEMQAHGRTCRWAGS